MLWKQVVTIAQAIKGHSLESLKFCEAPQNQLEDSFNQQYCGDGEAE